MATNSNPFLIRHVFTCWPNWEATAENLMLGYSEWRMRCYSETLQTFGDTNWHDFKRAFSLAEHTFNGEE